MFRATTILVSLFVFAIGALGGCATDSDPQGESMAPGAGGKADDVEDAGDELIGTYALDTKDFGGTLEILSASKDRIDFNLTVVGRFGGNPIGDIVEGVAEPTDGGMLVYSPGIPSDCDIFFVEVGPGSIELDQVGACSDAGFGANVDATGVYLREEDNNEDDAADAVPLGEYKLDTEDFGGTLEILSASEDRIDFTLTVVGRFGGNPIGDIFEGVAEPTDGGMLVYSAGIPSDCDIFFVDVGPKSIELDQVGACSDAGFGANVDATGVYVRD